MTLQQAIALHQHGKVAEAEAAYEQIIAAQPANAAALSLFGLLLLNTGRIDRAADVLARAVAANPADAAAQANLAAASKSLAAASLNSSAELYRLGRFDEALTASRAALARDPDLIGAHANAGLALYQLRRYWEAFAAFDRAVTLAPTDVDALHYRGVCLFALGRTEEALVSFERELALNPNRVMAHFDRALCLLVIGRWAEGWAEYEWRKKRDDPLGIWTGDGTTWTGREDLNGKILLIYAEQGFCDTLQLCRYALRAEAKGARVVILAPPPLHRLLRTLSPMIAVTNSTAGLGAIDYVCATFSLPLAFIDQPIPDAVPYLHATPEAIADWRARIGTEGFKIGVCWGVAKAKDSTRTFPLAGLVRLARLPSVRLISLQKGEELEQLATLSAGMTVELLGDDYDRGDFLDTAAVMANLDVVISCDTSVANLAGALGYRTWVAVKHVAEWRWRPSGPTTPWYPTARVFRQKAQDAWDGVFIEMEQALHELLGAEPRSTQDAARSLPIA